MSMNPKYPLFVPTRGRWEFAYTIKQLEQLKIPYSAVVEAEEVENYKAIMKIGEIITLPFSNKGLVAARNWIWDYAEKLGVKRFWTMDDNISGFFYLNKNVKYRVRSGTFLTVMEDFVEQYTNVPIAGMQYEMFTPRKLKQPPFIANTRIYSNMLIETDCGFRNRGVYNDDTDLCLRVLKSGLCTVLFKVFLADKKATMIVKGGNTPIYQDDGRLEMAKSLKRQHPDVTKIVKKWGRWQHSVDYSRFRKNRFKKVEGWKASTGHNNYGMKLTDGKPALQE